MRTKYIASSSLIVMGIGFVITLFMPQNIAVRLLQGGFEAGLVGGFADWFAVTALFRHPMGIPIPHTSLLLNNRDKIINSLISAMETELLNKESIKRKLSQTKIFKALANGIFKLIRKRELRKMMITSVKSVVETLPLDKVSTSLQSILVGYVRNKELDPIVAQTAVSIVESKYDEKVLDYALAYGKQWAMKPDSEVLLGNLVHGKLQEIQLGGMKGFAVQAFLGFMSEEKLGSLLTGMMISSIDDLAKPDSEYRERILHEIRMRLTTAALNPSVTLQLKSWLDTKLTNPSTQVFLLNQLEELRVQLLNKLNSEYDNGGRLIVSGFRWMTTTLNKHEPLVQKWEQSILTLIVNIVENNYYRLGLLVKDNLDQMDDQTLVRMLEDKVGNDLQWIRVNGALCGFIIGIILTVLHMLV
ncbi:DUF445 domain-containing protein [Paenibacillus macquariensis]|uniref:Uncharacterized membrane-anchored protein YjiN, DUF445 family n=1 Tax=Paenibacillus macquariensis TaxID=948756 RepID=A0ABY1K7D8_9BACL|nr:DUF445 domain-containing protein [Paenibacillus macquariensis]MEC0091073.1 DUF445 domain-containing protein [Paenibacillus macquariensis]OAB33738.1 hypothetical protein PMSM_14045 [Paenibacillus macquariensis subsp. macquariensis]SIR36945.1 Uncharacterized membrane-anchored protein YjiN, DUF445 family [Paenibacillus macquariensis]